MRTIALGEKEQQGTSALIVASARLVLGTFAHEVLPKAAERPRAISTNNSRMR